MSNAIAEASMMTRADAAELACLAIEIGSDLEAYGLVSSKLERLAAVLTGHAIAEDSDPKVFATAARTPASRKNTA
jgi:hypothetical protein